LKSRLSGYGSGTALAESTSRWYGNDFGPLRSRGRTNLEHLLQKAIAGLATALRDVEQACSLAFEFSLTP
jgi:hypothetical protein